MEPRRSAFDEYLRDIHGVALLTSVEERDLARKLQTGDLRAGHRLVTANLRFVVKIVLQYRSYGVSLSDLVQEGNLGLMRAVQKFDPDKHVRLVSYAVWWIRAYVLNDIRRSWSLVKIGTTQAQRRLFFSLARARKELERLAPGAGLEGDVEPEALARMLKVRAVDATEMMQRMNGHDVSLDAPLATRHDAGADATHLDRTPDLGDRQDVALEQREEQHRLHARVEAALAVLDPRERHLVQARLMSEEPVPLGQLGRHFGFSRERARQLELRAREKLRRELGPLARELGLPQAAEPSDEAPRRGGPTAWARSRRPRARTDRALHHFLAASEVAVAHDGSLAREGLRSGAGSLSGLCVSGHP